MTDLENYAQIINSIFGAGTSKFDTAKNDSHNVIGALNHVQYDSFKANFTARLKRLKSIYDASPTSLQKLIVQVNEIASIKNWQGAFAELAAFDHLNNDLLEKNNFLFSPIEIDVTLPKEESFALELNKQEANLDGYIDEFGLYFDIKVLKDNVGEILDGIYKDLQTGRQDLLNIAAEYDLGLSYGILQNQRNQLRTELLEVLDGNKKPRNFRSKVIPDLSFVFTWERGVSTAIRTYTPFSHAKNHHKNIFIYANKFLKKHPTFIIYVSFPWYNQVLNSKNNDAFFRSYARRVFCQYLNHSTSFSTISPGFSGTDSLYDVSTYLTGIIFLEDDTILSHKPDITNVKSSIYLNPNAKNALPGAGSMVNGFLHKICNNAFDNFEDDNY